MNRNLPNTEFFFAVAPNSLSPTPDGAFSELFRQVIQYVHLDQSGKMQLLKQLQDNADGSH